MYRCYPADTAETRQARSHFGDYSFEVAFAVDDSRSGHPRPLVIRTIRTEERMAMNDRDLARKWLKLPPHRHVVRLHEMLDHESYDEGGSRVTKTSFVMDRIIPEDPTASARLIRSKNGNSVTDPRRVRLHFQQLVCAVRHCHLHGIVPVGPRPSTVLFGSDADGVKLNISVGSIIVVSIGPLVGEAPLHMAPEVFTDESGKSLEDPMTDMWACGVLLYTMAFGQPPFRTKWANPMAIAYHIVHTAIEVPEGDWDPGLVDLVLGLLCRDPEARMTMDDVLQHPWFAEGFDPAVLSEFAHRRQRR